MSNSPPLDARVVALLKVATNILKKLKVKYAVVGGIAVVVHGIHRSTSDVDVFVLNKDRARILAAFRKEGLTVDQIATDHYGAWPARCTDPRIRVDIMFPAVAIEQFAAKHAKNTTAWKQDFNVVSPILLAAIKFLTGETKHLQDVRQMLQGGVVTSQALYRCLENEDPKAATRFVKWLNTPESGAKLNPAWSPAKKRKKPCLT